MSNFPFPVYEFRPLPSLRDVYRLAGGEWIADDGQHGLAFIGKHDGAPLGLSVSLPYKVNILWKYLDRHWRDTNNSHPEGNPWHYMLRDGESEWGEEWDRYRHQNIIASERASSENCRRFHCSNGLGPEFEIGDPYIAAGLVRNAETKEIVTFPSPFVCMHCGAIDATAPRRADSMITVTSPLVTP